MSSVHQRFDCAADVCGADVARLLAALSMKYPPMVILVALADELGNRLRAQLEDRQNSREHPKAYQAYVEELAFGPVRRQNLALDFLRHIQ